MNIEQTSSQHKNNEAQINNDASIAIMLKK
jgi:hypothetical protein